MTSERISDLDLIQGFKDGSKECFEELILRHEHKIYSIALRYTKSTEDAEEVMQDVCVTLFKKVESFEGKSAFSSWLYRIVVNTSLMKLRKRRQDKSTLIDDLNAQAKRDYFARSSESLQGGESVSIQKQTRAALEVAVNKLSDEYRTVFLMRDVEGLSNEEVSKALDISIPAVKSRLHRARLMLQKKLDRYWKDYQGVTPMVDYEHTSKKIAANF